MSVVGIPIKINGFFYVAWNESKDGGIAAAIENNYRVVF